MGGRPTSIRREEAAGYSLGRVTMSAGKPCFIRNANRNKGSRNWGSDAGRALRECEVDRGHMAQVERNGFEMRRYGGHRGRQRRHHAGTAAAAGACAALAAGLMVNGIGLVMTLN